MLQGVVPFKGLINYKTYIRPLGNFEINFIDFYCMLNVYIECLDEFVACGLFTFTQIINPFHMRIDNIRNKHKHNHNKTVKNILLVESLIINQDCATRNVFWAP